MFRIKTIVKEIVAAVICLTIMLGCSSFVLADTLTDNNGNSMQITSDEDYLYITYEGDYRNYLNSAINISIPGANLGALSQVVINQSNSSDSSNLTILNSWYQPISDATGTVTNSGNRMTYTIQVPWSTYDSFNPETVTVTWPSSNQSVTIDYQEVTNPSTEPSEPAEPSNPEEPEEPVSPVDPGTIVGGSIQIDGSFSDWNGYPVTVIGYSNNNDQGNHNAQIVVIDDSLYVHVKMSDMYTSQMPAQLWYISVNGGNSIPVEILRVNSNGQVNWGTPNSEGAHTDMRVFLGYNRNNSCGNAALTIYDSSHKTVGDEIEFSIDMDALANALGISREEMKTISISNPNIGSTSITVAGTSTGTYIGIGIALVATGATYVMALGKKKKETTE